MEWEREDLKLLIRVMHFRTKGAAASGERSWRCMAAPSGGHNRFCEAASERPEVESDTEEMGEQAILSRDWRSRQSWLSASLSTTS